LYLIQEDVLTLPILYLSRHIIKNKSEYYRLLLDITRSQAWEPWIIYLLVGIEDTARWTTTKISAIRNLSALTITHVKQAAPKIYSRELVDLIFDLPYCRIQNLVERGIAGRKSRAISSNLLKLGAGGDWARQAIYSSQVMYLLTRDNNVVTAYEYSA
jgi:Fic family protein